MRRGRWFGVLCGMLLAACSSPAPSPTLQSGLDTNVSADADSLGFHLDCKRLEGEVTCPVRFVIWIGNSRDAAIRVTTCSVFGRSRYGTQLRTGDLSMGEAGYDTLFVVQPGNNGAREVSWAWNVKYRQDIVWVFDWRASCSFVET